MMKMPRTVDEILQHADELAARFESYEPNSADELDPGAVTLLRAAAAGRSEAGRHLIAAARRTREAGMPWSAIGSSIRHQRPSRATAPRQECRLNYNTGPEHRGRSARSASLSSPSAAS